MYLIMVITISCICIPKRRNLLYSGAVSEDAVSFCERMLELLTDLEAQLPTRRFLNTLLDNTHFIVR